MNQTSGSRGANGAESLLIGLDFHGRELDEIFHVYERLRAECPVGRAQKYGGYWAVMDWDGCFEIERNPEIFISGDGVLLPSFGNPRPMIPIEVDPPMHGKYRRLLLSSFSPKAMDAIEPRVREIANQLIDGFIDRQTVDVASDFARTLPMWVFAEMVGLPEEDFDRYQTWVDEIIYGRTGGPEDRARSDQAVRETYRYFGELRRQRMRMPARDDLLDVLLEAEIDGRSLTEEEFVDIAFLLLLGGLETTAWAIRSALWHLAQHPAQRRRVESEPGLIGFAVEEVLRCLSPVQTMKRTVARDITFHGAEMKKGDTVVIFFGSANRDEAYFDCPSEFRIDRENNPHMAFGTGVHRCLGSNLGRREINVALVEFLRRIPDFEIAPGTEPKWHGIAPLDLRITRAEDALA